MATKVKGNEINFKGRVVSIGVDMDNSARQITALVEDDAGTAVMLARPN
jgi:hypothetical protein